jgi:hypothetical protein
MLLIAITHTKSIAQNEKFVGTWRIDMDRTLSIMDGNVKARYDTLSAEGHARAVNAMKDRVFAFSEDGSVAVNWTSRSGRRVSSGTWVVDEAPANLLIKIGERTTGFSYEFPSGTTLILRGKGKRGFFDNLYLKKIN